MTEHVLTVGTRVWFAREKRPYTVQASGSRYAVCTKPFAARQTVMYTIVDLGEMIRGTENLVFGMGAETREDCEDMLARLEGRSEHHQFNPTGVSYRNRVRLDIVRVSAPEVPAGTAPACGEDGGDPVRPDTTQTGGAPCV